MKKVLGTTLLLLLGSALGARVTQNRLGERSHNLNFAELEAGETSHTCQYAINRVKAGPANYKTIVGSG